MERISSHQHNMNQHGMWCLDFFWRPVGHYKEGKMTGKATLGSMESGQSLCALFLAMLLAGCAAGPMQVDLSKSVYQPQQVKDKHLGAVKAIKITNEAKEAELKSGLPRTYIPIKTEPNTRQTVEDDINKYLAASVELSSDSKKSLVVTILQADSYWSYSAAFGGLITAFAEKDFELNLNVMFDIKEAEKVVQSYSFNDKITLKGKAATQTDIQESYKRLIELYRRKFFGLLDDEFLNRYL